MAEPSNTLLIVWIHYGDSLLQPSECSVIPSRGTVNCDRTMGFHHQNLGRFPQNQESCKTFMTFTWLQGVIPCMILVVEMCFANVSCFCYYRCCEATRLQYEM